LPAPWGPGVLSCAGSSYLYPLPLNPYKPDGRLLLWVAMSEEVLPSTPMRWGFLQTRTHLRFRMMLCGRPGGDVTGSLCLCYTLAGNCTAVRTTPQSFSFGKTMCGMPFHSTYFWLRTITPTTAGLNDHYNKKQNQSYPGSFHRTALL
jgi:hypothetical protein